jgi:signal peptidase II
VLEGVLELRFAKNEDIAFSVLRGFGLHASPSLLVALSVASLGGLTVLWLAMRRQATLLHHVAFALVVSGALGNVADRYARGYVVDFIHLARWPIFNVADIAVVLGMGILVVAGLRSSRVPSAGLE